MLTNNDGRERWVQQDAFVVKLWLIFARLWCFGDKIIFFIIEGMRQEQQTVLIFNKHRASQERIFKSLFIN